MQSNWNEIYKITAQRTGKSEQLYKDVGNTVFARLHKMLKRPNKLIIKLKGIGEWFLRRHRMSIIVNMFPPNFDKTFDESAHPLGKLMHENRVETYNIFKERLKDYEEYIKERDANREIRRKTQVLLKPDDADSRQTGD